LYNFGTIYKIKDKVFICLISPPPGLPRRGGGVSFPPLVGGIEGGGKMAVTFILKIDPYTFNISK
jgi:hypothetical protein